MLFSEIIFTKQVASKCEFSTLTTTSTRAQAEIGCTAREGKTSKRKLQCNEEDCVASKRRKIGISSKATTEEDETSKPVFGNDTPVNIVEKLSKLNLITESSLLPKSNIFPNHLTITEYYSLSNSANSPMKEQNKVAKVEFTIDEIVWAKIKGFNHWPAQIGSFPSNKMAEVIWFNDYRKTKLYRTQLFKFLPNFDEFAKKFNETVGLEAAAKEALYTYGQNLFSRNLY